jgi:hypothetical protein
LSVVFTSNATASDSGEDDDDDNSEEDRPGPLPNISAAATAATGTGTAASATAADLKRIASTNSLPRAPSVTPSHYGSSGGSGGALLIDHLSELFGSLSSVCREQFTVIRRVFPKEAVARTIRMLIQRVFLDPAFGIQTKIDAVL